MSLRLPAHVRAVLAAGALASCTEPRAPAVELSSATAPRSFAPSSPPSPPRDDAQPAAAAAAAAAVDRAPITLSIGHETFRFGEECSKRPPKGSALGGARLRPGFPPHLWVTGCNGASGYFHAIIEREPSAGPASSSLLLVTLPGQPQQSIAKGAVIQITSVDADRIAGDVEFDILPAEGTARVRAHGKFDVRRVPDDTSNGP
jgi:hypothetical protein